MAESCVSLSVPLLHDLSSHKQAFTVLRALWLPSSAPWEPSAQKKPKPAAASVPRGKLCYQPHTVSLHCKHSFSNMNMLRWLKNHKYTHSICLGTHAHLWVYSCVIASASIRDQNYPRFAFFFCLHSFYCPSTHNGSLSRSYECPVGHYCPPGTWSRHQYPCPAGSINAYTQMTKPQDCLPCPPGHHRLLLMTLSRLKFR